MKNTIGILLLLFAITSCGKDNHQTIDYRDQFLGDYICKKTGNYHCGDTNIYYDTTVIVTITKQDDSLIHIFDTSLKIKSNGEFGAYSYPVPTYKAFGGNFINDSLKFTTYQGGLGCFTSLNYSGKKQQ